VVRPWGHAAVEIGRRLLALGLPLENTSRDVRRREQTEGKRMGLYAEMLEGDGDGRANWGNY